MPVSIHKAVGPSLVAMASTPSLSEADAEIATAYNSDGYSGLLDMPLTKTLTPRLRFSAGTDWGRLDTSGGPTNLLSIFGDHMKRPPSRNHQQDGDFKTNQFSRSDAASFGGIGWRASGQRKLNYVKPRHFDQWLSFQDYDVAKGHVSA